MKFFRNICFLSLLTVLLGAAIPCRADGPPFNYLNPIATDPIRAPQITKVGDLWYMTGTASPFEDNTSGVKLWSSKDLTKWKLESVILAPSPAPGKDHWYQKRFAAPELFPYGGKWYLTFTCPDADGASSIGLAMADTITGPYRMLTEEHPLTQGSDATLFQDDDGKIYLFLSNTDGIAAIQVDLDNAKTVGVPLHVLNPGPASAWDGTAPGGPTVSIDAPSVFKHDKTYYLMYASWGRGYEEGYATARSIHGPWVRYAQNPIYGGQEEVWSNLYKHKYTQPSSVPYTQVGHGSPFIGPDGELWFACHGVLKGADQQPHLILAPMSFDKHGDIRLVLTWTPQVLFLPKHFHVKLEGTRLASPALEKLAEKP
jgi:xylan 1,4-beta-xylosidase